MILKIIKKNQSLSKIYFLFKKKNGIKYYFISIFYDKINASFYGQTAVLKL